MSGATLPLLWLLWLLWLLSVGLVQSCPRSCNCYQASEVHCTFRSLQSVPPGLPPHTRRINLGFNSIHRLQNSSLSGLKNVELLMLHSNDLQQILPGVFRDMKNMQILKLSYNKLDELWSEHTFSGLNSLLRLYLDHNQLRWIHPRALLQLPRLRLLRLQGNRLLQLHPEALCTLSVLQTYCYSTLRHLDLSNNSLSAIPRELLGTAPLLETLALHANPWSCDCAMNWLLSWTVAHPGVMKCPGSSQCPVCASPLSLQDQGLLDLPSLPCSAPLIISTGLNIPLDLPDLPEILPRESFHEPLGTFSLSLSDQQGFSVDINCNVSHSDIAPDVSSELSTFQSFPLPLALSFALECHAERQNYEKLWRIMAYYSESAVRFERGLMVSKAPTLAYRYRQGPETEGEYHTGVKASITASPHWLLQAAISIQLNRARSNRKAVHLVLSTRVSAHSDLSTSRPWVLISTNHTFTGLSALSGSTIELPCPILSSGEHKVEWIFPDGSKILSSSSNHRWKVLPSALILQKVDLADAGLYYCKASNGKDIDIRPLQLVVIELPPSTARELVELSGIIGQPLTISCNASGSPLPFTSWLLPNGNLHWHGSALSGGITIEANGSLSLLRPSLRDAGHYRCIVVNQYGSDSLSTRLDLKPQQIPPLKSTFPRRPQSAAGRSTQIRAPLLRLDGGSGDGEEEKEENNVVRNRQPFLNNLRRRGPGITRPPNERRDRVRNRHRVTTNRQRIDPKKWADLLAKIREKAMTGSDNQPTEPTEKSEVNEDVESSGDDTRIFEEGLENVYPVNTAVKSQTNKETVESSRVNDASTKFDETPSKKSPPTFIKQFTTTTSTTSITKPTTLISIQYASTTSESGLETLKIVPKVVESQERATNIRHSSPWNARRRIGQRRRMFNPRGRLLTSSRPVPDPINRNVLQMPTTTSPTLRIRVSSHPSSTSSNSNTHPTTPSSPHFGTTNEQISLGTGGFQMTSSKHANSPSGKHNADTERNLFGLPRPPKTTVSSATSPSSKITSSSPRGVQSSLARSSTSAGAADNGDALLAVSLISQVTTKPVEDKTARFIQATAVAKNIPTAVSMNHISNTSTRTPSTTAITIEPSTATAISPTTPTAISITTSTFVDFSSTTTLSPVTTSTTTNNPASTSASTSTTISTTTSTATTTATSTSAASSTTTFRPVVTSTISTSSTDSTTTSTPAMSSTTTTTTTIATTTPTTVSTTTSTPATSSTIITTPTTASTTTSTPATSGTTTTAPTTTSTTTSSPATTRTKTSTSTPPTTTSINTSKFSTRTITTSAGVKERPRVHTDWRKPGLANFIPDSQSSRTHLPPAVSVPVPPRLHVPRSKPRISDPHIRSVSFPAESIAWLHCDAEGEPKPTISWTKVSTGVVMSVSSRAQRFEVLPNGTLVIQSVELQDRGTYICSAQNYMGRDRLLTTLDVWTRPPRMQLPIYRELTTHQGGDLTVDCQAQGVPAPLLSWVLPDRSVLSSSSSRTARVSMDTNGTLHLSAALPSDRGTYRCVASNSAGAASASVRVHVSSLPPTIQQPKEETLVLSPGMPLYAHCSARGAPNPTLRWKIPTSVYIRPSQFLHGNLFVLPNGTLHIRSISSKDTGSYECTASNAVGAGKRIVRVELSGNQAAGNRIVIEQTGFSSAARKDKAQTDFDLENSLNFTEIAAPSPVQRPRTVVQPIPANSLPKINVTPTPEHFTVGASNDAKLSVEKSRKITGSFEHSPGILLEVSQFSKAQIVSTSPSLSTVQSGGPMELHCHVTGHPPPNVIWRTPSRKLVDMHFSFERRLQVHPNGTLSVWGVTEQDAGDYLCIARNRLADDYRLVRVNVAPKPVSQPARQPARQPAPQPAHQPTRQPAQQTAPQPALQPDRQPDRKPDPQPAPQPASLPFPQSAQQPTPKPANELAHHPSLHSAPQPSLKFNFQLARQPAPQPAPQPATKVASIRQTQPVHQLVSLGKSLQLDCLASGHPDPLVRWILPDGTMVNSVLQGADNTLRARRLKVFNNGTLLVVSVGRGEEGMYTCSAENQAGRDTMKVQVKVLSSSLPSFDDDDAAYRVVKVQLGTSAKLPCQASGDPAPSVTWFSPMNRIIPRTSRSGFYTERVVVVSDGTLELRIAQKQDTGNYTCQATNTAGTRRKVVRVEVEVPSAVRNSVPGNPVLNRHVTGVTTQLGRSIVSVGVSGASNVGFGPDHFAINRNNIGANSNTLGNRQSAEMINNKVVTGKPNNDVNRRAIYLSSGVANIGHSESRIRNGVTSNASLSPGMVLIVKQQVTKGQSVFLHCPAQGSSTSRLIWLLPGNTALSAPHFGSRLTVHRNGTLELRGVSDADQGRFVCVVRGERGESRLQVELDVKKEPHRGEPHADSLRGQISARPVPRAPSGLLSAASWTEQVVSTKTASLVSIINGETLRLPCSAPQSAPLSQGPVSWSLPNGQRLSSTERQGLYSVQSDGTLTVQQASVFDRGTYTCRFSAPFGVVEVTVPVIVIAYPPRITSGPAPVTYTRPGVAVELPCLTIATPRATVTWEMPDMSKLTALGQARIYGNRYLSAQGSLVIQSPSSRDTGFYRCTAKNVIGADTKATYLHVI
ncbi:matrix-remodeling-associated protein 5-like [Eucyclogobius newberryi]|uniref:matrix-remodeling-associated protein 5-like n=1 Tax=Eucyclogobius newberryi TaxID=166745 RepID=UPI003B5C99C2